MMMRNPSALVQACAPKRASFGATPNRVGLLHRDSRCPISHEDRMTVANQLLRMNRVDLAPEATTPEQMEEKTKLQLSGLLQRRRSAEFECAAQILKSATTLSSFCAGLQQQAQDAEGRRKEERRYPLMDIVAIDVRERQLVYQLEPPANSPATVRALRPAATARRVLVTRLCLSAGEP